MSGLLNENSPMSTRIREFDPSGEIVRHSARIAELIGSRMNEVGDVAFEKAMSLNGMHLTEQNAVIMREGARAFYPNMLDDLGGEGWANRLRDFVLGAVGKESVIGDYSPRMHAVTLDAAFQKAAQIMVEALEDKEQSEDDEAPGPLFAALATIALISVDLIYATYNGAKLQIHQTARDKERVIFTELLTGQIDSAATLGDRLRDQAREASTATRGMLDKASEVAAAAEQSAIAMREAAHTSSGLIRAIEEARSEVDQAAEVAARASTQAGEAVTMSATLSDHAQSIESILGLIRDIAGQTNLLALNATIEAARAGDAGRGFAVVAQEVKSLASQTARATDDIAHKIAAIQNATRQSVETNDRIRATVQDVQTMNLRIRTAMDAQSQTVTMITAAVDETALAADSMSSNISAIRQDTEIVASEIDELETGFSDVQQHLDGLREKSINFVDSVEADTQPLRKAS